MINLGDKMIKFIKQCIHCGSNAAALVAFVVAFSCAKSIEQRNACKQGKRNQFWFAVLAIKLITCGCCILYNADERDVHSWFNFKSLSGDKSAPLSLICHFLFADYVIKVAIAIVKTIIIPSASFPFQTQGEIYTVIEYAAILTGELMPLNPWLCYLTFVHGWTTASSCIVYSWTYLMLSLRETSIRYKDWSADLSLIHSCERLWLESSTMCLADMETTCPICLDKIAKAGVIRCSHIFCEECLGNWLDIEPSCPICRTKVHGGVYSDGSSS